jgi:hypothetical protein
LEFANGDIFEGEFEENKLISGSKIFANGDE